MSNNIIYKTFLLFFVFASFACVPRFKVQKMYLDEKSGYYKYSRSGNTFALRLNNNGLVFRDSLKTFLTELSENGLRYNFDFKSENNLLFRRDEKSLTGMYNEIQQLIDQKNAPAASYLITEFEKLYPQAYFFTDIDFLKGKIWEQLDTKDSANFYYQRFLKFSEKKYSSFFRGYTYDEEALNCYYEERQYAQEFKSISNTTDFSHCFKELTPQYYYQSFSQGFVFNKEDFPYQKRNIIGFGIEYDKDNQLKAGVSNTWLANENYILRTSIAFAKNMFQITLSGSYQLYKSVDNAFGIKLSPGVVFSQFGNNDSILPRSTYYNPYVNFSMGYHFNQRWYIGASYSAFLFNQYDHDYFNQSYFLENNYDISLYYQLMKGISFKVGLDTGYPVIGFGLNGSSLGYFFKNKSVGVRMDYY